MATTGCKIGLIGAMVEEVELIIRHMNNQSSSTKAGIEFHEGTLHGCQVVTVKCGVGKVNAAICTQILIDTYKVDSIIFTGVAGALHPDLDIGDIVISSECMQHDMDVTALGFELGTIPFAPVSVFPSDPKLAQLAFECSKQLFGERVRQGRILSGDQFIADREEVQRLHRQLQGICTEMEGAAVAQVCSMNQIPHVIIRSMSDKANGHAPANFQQFCTQAAEHSYRIVDRMLQMQLQ